MSDMIASKSKMIELVAGAIAEVMSNSTVGPKEFQAARAALKALREPTDEMVERGSGHISDDHVLVDEYDNEAKLCWQAMIDAALHSGKEEK